MSDIERKLATIRQISDARDIVFTNADGNPETAENIVAVQIDGWHCVAKRGEFEKGSLCVYFEIDSLLDSDNPDFAFMEKSKWRVKTIRLKGQLSQGLAMPLNILNECGVDLFMGQDVSDLLKITKYEAPIPDNLRGKVKGSFPGFLIKTDEERIQNIPEILTQYPNNKWDVTEKLDGTSFTCYFYNDTFGVCSRNMELLETEGNVYWQIARAYDIEAKLRDLGKNVCIQGEIVGQGIQGNKYNLPDKQLFVFNVYWIDEGVYSSHTALQEFCAEYGLAPVPTIYEKTVIYTDVDAILEIADGPSVLNSNTKREGLVWRTNILENGKMEKISFKTISNKFLLKHGE